MMKAEHNKIQMKNPFSASSKITHLLTSFASVRNENNFCYFITDKRLRFTTAIKNFSVAKIRSNCIKTIYIKSFKALTIAE